MSPLPSVAAVVVSFDRRDLLVRVLEALRAQTRPVDELIVVDNGSTDGTRELLRGLDGPALVVESARNGGGAGGFATGLAWAIDRGHDLAWLMDDDAVPHDDCLERLLAPYDNDPARWSFACPQVVDADGATGPRNYPVLATRFDELLPAAEHGYLATVAASFVGPLISLPHAVRTHLPLADFFVWHDDTEYTARLAALAPAITVPTAKITHLADSGGPGTFHPTRASTNVRNLVWWWREASGSTIRRRVIVWWAVSIVLGNVRSARLRDLPRVAVAVARGLSDGIARRPRRETADSAVARSRIEDRVIGPRSTRMPAPCDRL